MSKINYREDQIPIINYQNGTMAVPAVPGAGKTFIVTNLVAKLLSEDKHKGGKILILTYMNSAVNNFKGRIKKILKDNEIKQENSYEVMTIHSLAVKIIKEKPEVVMLNEEFSIADDLQKSIILNECITKFRLNGGERAYNWFLKEQKDEQWRDIAYNSWEAGFYDLVSNTISELKYKDILPDTLEAIVSNEYRGILKLIQPIYKQYDMKLKQNGLLDYDDILVLAYKALKIDEGLRAKLQNRYKYIFEDECQDSNEIQGKIIKLITQESNNLVRVGDINQSITGTFSASDPKYFKEFIEEASYCYRMDMSNRSSKDILDLANRLVNYVTKEFKEEDCKNALEDMQIRTVPTGMGYKGNPNPSTYSINTKIYKTWQDEMLETIRYVKGIKKKYPDKSIGILVPFNDQITQVSKILSDNNMEFEELGPNSMHKRKVLINLSYIIDFILNCDDIDKLINTLDKIFINTDNELGKKDFLENIKKFTTEEILYSNEIEDLIIDTKSDVYKGYIKGVNAIKDILQYPITNIESLILFIGDKLELEKEDKALIDYISFYVKYLLQDNINMTLKDIHEILSNTKNRVFNYIVEVVYEINGYEPQPGSITVCNYHKSKGLEWDCVFLLGLVEYNFPHSTKQKFQGERWYLKDKYKNPLAIVKSEIEVISNNKVSTDYIHESKIDLINEKIRLLYVGVTRAKEMLILSCSMYKDESEVNKKNKQQKPSLYIQEFEKYIKQKRNEKGVK